MQRTYWYEPRIDAVKETPEAAEQAAYLGRETPQPVNMDEPANWDVANLVGSLVEGDILHHEESFHMPVIDFDAIPMRIVPSSTPGNFHLYIDTPIKWSAYKNLLESLAEAGLVEDDYVEASIRQGATFVRREGVRKPVTLEDAPNLISGVCCGDPGDCMQECGMGRH